MKEILFVVEEAEDGSFRASAAAAAIQRRPRPLIRLHHVKQELLAL
jgi:hypothetical protein